VQDVGVRIAAAVEEFLEDHGRTERLEWEFNLIDSPEMNAWAMPGGKVAIYQGLMEITNTPPKLAAVMGHEVAHVIAGHGSERLSQGLLTQMGGMALSAALSNRPDQTRALWMQAYGLGAQVGVMLPYSRLHEREADRLGLIFMALAGYDPHAALEVWTAMAQRGTGPGVPAFLSTHPTDEQRISDIRSYLPEALQYYRPR
jgi:predicted Zn-dependent protease